MMRLIRFELEKIWRKKQLLALLVLILVMNTALHWYGNRADEYQPGLASYKKAAEYLSPMSEKEKSDWLQARTEELEGLRVTDQIISWSGRDENALEELSEEHQEIFRRWYPVYQKGGYLLFTGSLDQEITLTDELNEEAQAVTHYDVYLQKMQESREELSGISIFAGGKARVPGEREAVSFSQKNIEKSRKDYQSRSAENVKWFPSKGIVSAMDSLVTGILYFVGIFLFAVWGILEEKEKRLFFITRVTDRGILPDILARIVALGLCCVLFCFLIYGSNWIFYGITIGFPDLSLDIQSVSAYMQSCYTMTLGQYVAGSVLTKAAAAFCFGLLLEFITVISRHRVLPFVTGAVVLAGNILLYGFLPSVGVGSILKYMNLMGIFHTENLYGDYLNFDIGGTPVSRMACTLVLLVILLVTGIILVAAAFCRGRSFFLVGKVSGAGQKKLFCRRLRAGGKISLAQDRAGQSLFRYECHKLFLTNRALLVLLGCLLLAGGYHASRHHRLSVIEQYYKELMMELEGELTGQKEKILLSEKERYDDAYGQLDRISRMEAEGKLSRQQADEQKERWHAVVMFYPGFQRAWQQYERIGESGGLFIYDTGYLYLFGVRGEGFLTELVVFAIGILLMFSNCVAMEYQNKTSLLICSSFLGMGAVLRKKAWLCVLVGTLLPAGIRVFQCMWLQGTFPMHYWGSSVRDIARYQGLPVDLPIWLFVAGVAGVQAAVCILLALCITGLSYWRKNFMQTVLAGAVLFVVPLVLYAMGISFMRYLTVYPLYTAGFMG